MKRLLMLLLFTSSSLFTGIPHSKAAGVAALGDNQIEQAASENQPYYLYQGKRIPLEVRNDAVAVAFKPQASTRGSAQPQYLQLQAALNSGTRSTTTTEISPLGQRYAIATLPTGTRNTDDLQSRIEQQPFVETTLPVLSSPGQSETIILNDELIVSFDPGLSPADQQAKLSENGVEILRPLALSNNRYIVRTPNRRGLATLELANRLAEVPGIQSVSPNFIQQVTRSPQPGLGDTNRDRALPSSPTFNQPANASRTVGQNSLLLPWQWHISSLPMLSCLSQNPANFSDLANCLKPGNPNSAKLSGNLQRTDLRIPEAWNQGQQGKGTVVAVIDSLIQWDHPALRDNLHRVNHPQRCSNEVYGWDFSTLGSSPSADSFCDLGDGETRMEQAEFAFLQRRLKQALKDTDDELLDQYSVSLAAIRKEYPNASLAAIAAYLREDIKQETTSEFHGTSVSSIVAANTPAPLGMIGVAPNAKILPVRVMGLNGNFSLESYLLGILYAANRGADVINISLGGAPTDEEANTIAQVLAQNPKLVIVASSGNDDNDEPNYPAAFPGVLSVGASNLLGQRAPYSSFGATLDVVAPGGDVSEVDFGGLLVAGGTWVPELWAGIPEDRSISDRALDPRGTYFFTEGTSFASPAVAGVIALMKGADPQRQLTRDQLTAILQKTANPSAVSLSEPELAAYRAATQAKGDNVEAAARAYFLGSGLVDAEAAVKAVRSTLSSPPR